jgi:hypothetical protein
MQVEKDEAIRNKADLDATVDRATRLLEEQLGPSAAGARAQWTFSQDDRGRDVVGLNLSDWTGSVGYRFAPIELKDEAHMRLRLHRLWGDLLQVSAHHSLDSQIWSLNHGVTNSEGHPGS